MAAMSLEAVALNGFQPRKEASLTTNGHNQKENFSFHLTGLLSREEQEFRRKMKAQGFSFELSPNAVASDIEWPGQEQDFARMDQIAEWLNDPDLPDEDFQKHIRPGNNGSDSIAGLLASSELFSQLINEDQLENGYKVSSFEHILKVLEYIQTDELSPEIRCLLRHMVFFHDLAKSIDPNQPAHGFGSSVIAKAYYTHANGRAIEQGNEPVYSQEFIDTVVYLCRTHHIFAEIGKLLKDDVSDLVAKESEKHPGLNGHNTAVITAYLGLLEESESDSVIDFERFKLLFRQYVQDPRLLVVSYLFTVADIQASESHQKYLAINYALLRLLSRSLMSNERAVSVFQQSGFLTKN